MPHKKAAIEDEVVGCQAELQALAAFSAKQGLNPRSLVLHKVVTTLMEIGVRLKENLVIKEGYSIDALVLWENVWVAFEVDGPCHFFKGSAGRSATGATLLR